MQILWDTCAMQHISSGMFATMRGITIGNWGLMRILTGIIKSPITRMICGSSLCRHRLHRRLHRRQVCVRQLNAEVDEYDIQKVMMKGGAGVMKRYGDLHQPNITYIEDICANAKGYATLASGYLKVILERQAGGDK